MGKKTASTSTSGCPRAGNKVWIPVSQRIPPQSLHQSFKLCHGMHLVLQSQTYLKSRLRQGGVPTANPRSLG